MRLKNHNASQVSQVIDGAEERVSSIVITGGRTISTEAAAAARSSKRSQETSNNARFLSSTQATSNYAQDQASLGKFNQSCGLARCPGRGRFRCRRLGASVSLQLATVLLLGSIVLAAGQTNLDDSLATPIGELEPSSASPDGGNGSSTPTAPSTSSSSSSSSASGGQHKLKPINFTQVDEIFRSSLADDEVARRWKRMDSQLQDGMKSILKMIFPQIVAISQDAKVSGDCSGAILKWILSLRNLRSWAIKMLDATGKPTAGIFEGSLSMLGNFRQCLSIRSPDEDEIEITEQFEEYFRGQFCVLHLKPWMPAKRPFYHLNESFEFLLRKNYKYYEKTLYDELAEIAVAFQFVDIRLDLCVPSTCTMADIQRVADLLSKTIEMRAKVMRCDTAPRDTSLLLELDQTIYLWLLVPLALIGLSAISTILVALGFKSQVSRGLRRSHFFPIVQQQTATSSTSTSTSLRQTKLSALFLSLSFNGARQEQNPDPSQRESMEFSSIGKVPATLLSLRNLFVVWFIIVQMTVELKYQYLRESLNLRNMILSYWPFQFIINSTLLFEALIVISAFIYSYSSIESNFKSLLAYLLDKYISRLLVIVTVIALTIVTPILAIESPIWRNFVESQADVCRSTGYVDLFFLQNFISYDKICLPHTWLFCVELQLLVLMIPLMLDFRKNFSSLEESLNSNCQLLSETSGKSGRSLINTILGNLLHSNAGLLSVLLILIGYCVNFVQVYANQLPPSWFYSFPDLEQRDYYFSTYLTKTWTHLSSFMVGMLAGHVARSHLQLKHSQLVRLASVQTNQQADRHFVGRLADGSPQLSHGSTSTIMAMEMSQANLAHTEESRPSSSLVKRVITSCTTASLLLVMLLIIMSTFTWSTRAGPSPIVAALYDATSRLAWSAALAVLLYKLCHSQKDNRQSCGMGLLERTLNHPISTSLGKISPIAYLVAPYVNTVVLAVEEQTLFPSMLMMFHVIFGNIAIIYALALLLASLIEEPMRRLVRQI